MWEKAGDTTWSNGEWDSPRSLDGPGRGLRRLDRLLGEALSTILVMFPTKIILTSLLAVTILTTTTAV